MSAAPPVFGKRNASLVPLAAGAPCPAAAVSPTSAAIPDGDYAAFLAATREAFAKPEQDDVGRVVVPRSVIAAFLAAVIVGCCLVGLDIARVRDAASTGGMVIDLSALMGGGIPETGGSRAISPGLILAGTFGGARAAGVCLLIGHEALSRLGLTSHLAYAATSAALVLALAAGLSYAIGMPPSHGWLVTGLAGAATGFFYRMFAGTRAA